MNFIGSHILSVSQFQRDDIETVFNVADKMIPYANRDRVTRVLEGAILGNMFFEPSTRTRVSFGCAWNLLGGEVRETTEALLRDVSPDLYPGTRLRWRWRISVTERSRSIGHRQAPQIQMIPMPGGQNMKWRLPRHVERWPNLKNRRPNSKMN